MHIELDLNTVPPGLRLSDADNFADFAITARRPQTASVSRQTLEALAGDRAGDPEWQRQLDAMIAYARSRGWIGDDGAIQGHIEWR